MNEIQLMKYDVVIKELAKEISELRKEVEELKKYHTYIRREIHPVIMEMDMSGVTDLR